jgi:mannose/cellobiose epimerase-like protein (N-acyl-D-glucosamine 2-epimerase family)
MDLAISILKKTWEQFNDPRRHVARKYLPLSYPGMRTLASHMVMIRNLTQILGTYDAPDLARLSDEIVDRIVNCFWNPEHELMNEVLDHEYRCRDDANKDFFYLGHAIETLWMLLDEALRRKDQGLFDLVAHRFRRHLEMSWDHEYGGFFCATRLHGCYEPDKYLWVQEEALVGCMLLMEHTTQDWPREWFEKTFEYVEEKFSLKPYGYPLYIHSGDREVTFQPHVARKENYHHPRRLILNISTLNRMIEQV